MMLSILFILQVVIIVYDKLNSKQYKIWLSLSICPILTSNDWLLFSRHRHVCVANSKFITTWLCIGPGWLHFQCFTQLEENKFMTLQDKCFFLNQSFIWHEYYVTSNELHTWTTHYSGLVLINYHYQLMIYSCFIDNEAISGFKQYYQRKPNIYDNINTWI